MIRSAISLRIAGNLTCVILTIAGAQLIATAQTATPPKVFAYGSLIKIGPPSAPLKVGEESEISLILHDKGLTSASTSQEQYLDREHKIPRPYGIFGGDQKLPVFYRPDGSAYIRFVPLRLGELGLNVFGSFPDKAFDHSHAILQVVPSNRKPAALLVAQGGMPGSDTDILRLNLDGPQARAYGPQHMAYLYPKAFYFDLHQPIELDRSFVHFTVRQPKNDPVIDFDPATGGMRPVRRGAALVETFYGGLVKRTCILVRVERDINDHSDCEPLFSAARPRVSAPLKTTWPQNPYGMSNPFMSAFEFFTDRLQVTPSDHPVEFGQSLEIPLKLSAGELLYYTVAQSKPGLTNPNGRRMTPGAAGTPLDAVNLVPLILGDDLVLITAHFADHGVSQRYFRLHVTPSCKGLKSISLYTFPMDDGHLRVTATLHYDQLRDPVQFPDLKRLTYRIDPSATPGVLRIEPDGQIRRVRSGYAAIIATYCGVTGGVAVKVNAPVQSQAAPTPHP